MRRITLIVLALMVCSIASAVPINPTVDWYTSHTPYRHYNTAYNPATGHLITNTRYYSGSEKALGYVPELSVWDSTDGSYIKGLAFAAGSSPFSLTCTTDGVIYGADLNIGEVVSKWADENTSPGVLMPAPGLSFTRQCKVRGTSTSPTLYMANGSDDNDKGQVLQLEATLTTWSVVSVIPAPFCKSAVMVKDRDTICGAGPWMNDGDDDPLAGFPDVRRNMNPGSWAYANWVRDDVFSPGDATRGGWSYSLDGDYADGLYWVLLYWDARIVAYEAVHGTILANMPVDTWGYLSWGAPALSTAGSLVTEETGAPSNTIFWGSRLGNVGYNGALGKMTYTTPLPVINEVDYDNPGTDTTEFIELWGLPGTDISGYQVIGHTASSGDEYATFTVPAATVIPADGFYVIGAAGVPNVDQVTTVSVQNGAPDAIVLRNAGGTIIDALGYEMRASAGALSAWMYEGTGLHGGDNFGSECSVGRKADGLDSDDNQADFDVMKPTPGELNRQFTLWSSGMAYVDTFPFGGPELAWFGTFVDATSVYPGSVGAPNSPETLTVDGATTLILTGTPDSVGKVDDPAGGGQVNMLGDHNVGNADINIQGWAYIGVDSEQLALFVRGIGDVAWHSVFSDYEDCYALEYFDDGTTSVIRAMKELGEDGSRTIFASDYSVSAPGWHHMRINVNDTTIETFLDSTKLSQDVDTDIATGPVGIAYYGDTPASGMLVDSIIINMNFGDATTEVADWNLF